MFSKLPQKLASPFGLLVDDSKLVFRTQPGGIRKLAETRNITTTDAYWDQYATLFDSASDVFSLISSNDVRRALTDAPENVITLVNVLSFRLFNLVADHTFPSTSNGVASLATSFIKSAASSAGVGNSQRNTSKEVLNCLRVLERILPVLFEEGNDDIEKKILLSTDDTQVLGIPSSPNLREPAQFVIDDEEDDEAEGPAIPIGISGRQPGQGPNDTSRASDRMQGRSNTKPVLAERLISCAIDLLFCCGFTLPSKIQVDHHKINYVIWEKGVGSTADPGPSTGYEQNRAEVLRFILVLLSKPIYYSPTALLSTPSPYGLVLVQRTARRHVLTILCSLLNTAMNSSKPLVPASAGSAIGSVASSIPYNHLVFKGEDMRLVLVGQALQTLCALLDFQSGPARDVLVNVEDPMSASPTPKTNAFRYFLAKLHRHSDFEFIADGIIGILEQHMNVVNNMLPGSKRPVPYVLETIVFLWKTIELNKKFRTYILESEKAVNLLAYLLCYCMEAKDKPQQHGVCRTISYILQTLSSEKAFNDRLSSPVKMQLPTKWACQGTTGDFMINSIYSVIATTSGQLNSLYPALIIALSNSAPYFKRLSVVSSNRLISLFAAFANPSFLLSDEGHPRLLFFLLEVFNGIIYNNLDENPNVLYAVIRSHKVFEDLGTFTLARGLREIRRVQLAREEEARRKAGNLKNGSADAGQDAEGPEHEKARLLSTESRDALGLSADVDLEARMPVDRPRSVQANASDHTRQGSESEITSSVQPLMSPSREDFPQISGVFDQGSRTASPSEKARGKMRAQDRPSLERMDSLERIAAAGIGRNGFVPTQDWVTSWQQGLPLDTVLLAISELLPKVQQLQSKSNATSAILDFLRSVSLKEVLPITPPPPSRRFLWSDSSLVWLTSLLWGEIYVRGMTPLGIWNATNVRLFHVRHTQAQTQTRQISDAVSHVVGGLGGLLSRGSSENLTVRGRTGR